MRRERMQAVAGGDHHPAAGGERDPRRLQLGDHPAGAVAGARRVGHRLDLGRDLADFRNQPGRLVLARIGGVEAVDVGEQDEGVGADHGGDAGAETVVVAEADLVGGDGVVLVDQRHRAPPEQRRQSVVRALM